MHIGSTIGDTSGCILIGERYFKDIDGDYALHKPTKGYKQLYTKIIGQVKKGEVELEK